MAHDFPPLSDRPIKDTLVLFDVDGTLTPARRVILPEPPLADDRPQRRICFNFSKNYVIKLQLASSGEVILQSNKNSWVQQENLVSQRQFLNSVDLSVIDLFDYCFAENGLTAYKQGTKLPAEVNSHYLHS